MATLYEIDAAIMGCIDTETGEIIDLDRLSELQMQRDEKIEGVALWYKNLVSDTAAIKAEIDNLKERLDSAKTKADRLKDWLTQATNGQKMSTPRVAISFRKSEAVEIENEAEFIRAAQDHDRDDLLTFKAPTPNKTAIKTAIKDGQEILGCCLIEKNNINIK